MYYPDSGRFLQPDPAALEQLGGDGVDSYQYAHDNLLPMDGQDLRVDATGASGDEY